jgi:hypothetical protein
MRIAVFWDNESQTILRFDFSANWRWTDFAAAVDASSTFTANKAYSVDIIGNLQAAPYLPFSYPPAQLLQAAKVPSSKIGLIALINTPEAIKTLTAAFLKVCPAWHEKLMTVDSLDEARMVLVQLRQERLVRV